jgi:hypothetical protein
MSTRRTCRLDAGNLKSEIVGTVLKKTATKPLPVAVKTIVHKTQRIAQGRDANGTARRGHPCPFRPAPPRIRTCQNSASRPLPYGRSAGRTSGEAVGIADYLAPPLGWAFCKNWGRGEFFSLLATFFYLDRILQFGWFPWHLAGRVASVARR